ncbi:hypothetical protein KEM55_004677 [Ascosphaera atra]|nr:hypothetical protein KEM55_004677 [Ascosphaera atra]
MPAGPLILKKYMDRVRECIMNQTARDETIWRKVCGVRYLVQDKPPGVMLQPDFIKGLRWLGEVGLTFDLGVDQRSGGIWQLQEATQMLQQVHEENGKVKVIINHLCKPNLQIISTKSCSGIYTDPDFLAWKQCITEMSHFSNVYMKLSGGFSEIPPLPASTQGVEEAELTERLAGLIRPWTDHIFDVFTASRVMFGSDWPVCNIGGGGNNVAWSRWAAVVEHTLEDRKLSASERRAVWGDNALRAYGIEPA